MSRKQALGIFVKDESPVIICRCGFICDESEIEVDDYVASNCLIWCGRCDEVLLCPTGYNSTAEINQLENGISGTCSLKVSLDHAQSLFPEIDLLKVTKDNFPSGVTAHYYLIGVIHLTGITTDFDDEINEKDILVNAKFTEVSADCFKELPDGIDCSHGGTYLAYQGYCNNCSRECKSYIWGD